jgi:hypothetical protein
MIKLRGKNAFFSFNAIKHATRRAEALRGDLQG